MRDKNWESRQREPIPTDWVFQHFPNKHLNTRSLIDRGTVFSSTVLTLNYKVICLCKTWLNKSFSSREFLLINYGIYRKDREINGDKNFHSGSLKVVKSIVFYVEVRTRFPNSCVACRIQRKTTEVVISAFNNPP